MNRNLRTISGLRVGRAALGLVGVLMLGLMAGCSTTDSATQMHFTRPDGTTMAFVFPKELDADELKLRVDAANGVLRLEAKRWKSRSVEVIKAAGAREAANVKAASGLANKISSGISEGAVKGAMKGVVP